MNNLEKNFYESIKELYYDIFESNREEIIKLIPENIKYDEDENIFTKDSIYFNVDYMYELHKKFMDKIMQKFCFSDKKIKKVTSLAKGNKTYFRGIGIPNEAYLKNLDTQIYVFHRDGLYGCGQYFTLDKSMAMNFASGDKNNLLQANFDKDTKQIASDDIGTMFYFFVSELLCNTEKKYDEKVVDFIAYVRYSTYMKSAYAGAMGFDVINNAKKGKKDSIFCVLNPEKVSILTNEK